MPPPTDTIAVTRDRQADAERLLEVLVNQPSGSSDREGVARAIEWVGTELATLGFEVELVRDDGLPRHALARLRGRGAPPEERPVLLVGHADTVFPRTDARRVAVEGDLIHGPGCADMKGGLVVAIEALRALGRSVREGRGAVEFLVNGDEELGSPASRELVRERSRAARAVLVFENSEEEDALIVGRKGLGRATVRIRGRAAHAGVAPEKGASAVIEMAREVLEIARLDDPPRGLGVVVGVARGGISRNTVPPEAEIEVDLRYRARADGEGALAAIRAIAARTATAGTTAAVEGELHRPPMRPESAAGDLLARAQRAAAALGRTIRGVATGGGSDANLAADLGVPTIDGLGVVGGDIHTRREWCLRRSLAERAALAAVLIQDILEDR
jgi:glutamate carboxypeptidase